MIAGVRAAGPRAVLARHTEGAVGDSSSGWCCARGAVPARAARADAARRHGRRASRSPCGTPRWRCGSIGLLTPGRLVRRRPAVARTWLQHLLIADLAAPLHARRAAQPGARCSSCPARRSSRCARTHWLRSGVPVPAPAAGRAADLRARALRLALRRSCSRPRVQHPLVHALQHSSLHRDRRAGLVVGARAQARGGCAASCGRSATSCRARFLGMFLGMSFVLIRHPIYTDVYGERPARATGCSAAGRPAARRRA